jgi:hypothetical protein
VEGFSAKLKTVTVPNVSTVRMEARYYQRQGGLILPVPSAALGQLVVQNYVEH